MRTFDGLLDSNPLVHYALAFIPRLSNGFGYFPPHFANLVFQRRWRVEEDGLRVSFRVYR